MAQAIKQGDIFGRIGTGFGRGLAEQIPKEIDRNRLSSGLSAFEQDHQNLNPMQQLARLSAIPGVTPQTIQSFSELAKVNNQGNFYKNLAGYQPPNNRNPAGPQGPVVSSSQPLNGQQINPQTGLPVQQTMNQQNSQQQVAESGKMQQRVAPRDNLNDPVSENTFNPNALSRLPWTPERRNKNIADYVLNGALPVEAKELTADDEARERGEAPILQQRQREDMERTTAARNELDRQLDIKLQKSGEDRSKDLTGEMLINFQRGMKKALRNDPSLSIEDAANEWSDKALNTAKTKNQLDRLAKSTGIESLVKGEENLKKLKSYADIFKNSGNSEELYNILRKDPEEGGFGFSPQGSALVAFDLNKDLNQYAKEFKPNYERPGSNRPVFGASLPNAPDQRKIEATARKAAIDVGKLITENDSLLAVARALSDRDPYFNQGAFFDQLREDQDQLTLNDRQRRELSEGTKDLLPTWGDLLFFPWFGRTK